MAVIRDCVVCISLWIVFQFGCALGGHVPHHRPVEKQSQPLPSPSLLSSNGYGILRQLLYILAIICNCAQWERDGSRDKTDDGTRNGACDTRFASRERADTLWLDDEDSIVTENEEARGRFVIPCP